MEQTKAEHFEAEKQPIVMFENVSIERGGKTIWSDGNFEIQSNTITAVIGSNGSGKTTLIHLILGLLEPTTGKVSVAKNTEIGYVPQDYANLDGDAIRVIDFVRLGLSGEKFGMVFGQKRKDELAKVRHALELTGVSDLENARISDLSGGQRQRVAISSAIVSQPQLLILDEPLSSLDLDSAREISALLSRLHQELGITIIIVAHDLTLLLPIMTGAIYLLDSHPHYSLINEDDERLTEHLYANHLEIAKTPQGNIFFDNTAEPHTHTHTPHTADIISEEADE